MIELSELREILGDLGAQEPRLAEARATAIDLWETATDALWDSRVALARVYRRRGSEPIWLPLQNITTLVVEAKSDAADTYAALVEDDDFEADVPHGLSGIYKIRSLSAWPDFVRATMTGGYSSTDCPSDIKHALAMEVGFLLKRWAPKSIDVEGLTVGDATTQYLRTATAGSPLGVAAMHHPVFQDAVVRYRVHSL